MPSQEVKRVWDKGYDEHGDWSIALAGAQAAAEESRKRAERALEMTRAGCDVVDFATAGEGADVGSERTTKGVASSESTSAHCDASVIRARRSATVPWRLPT